MPVHEGWNVGAARSSYCGIAIEVTPLGRQVGAVAVLGTVDGDHAVVKARIQLY
jgi:hypothetical protein